MPTKQELYKLLNESGVAHSVVEHAPVYTIEEMYALHLPEEERIAKNLFLREDKTQNHFLLTMPGGKKGNLKLLAQRLGVKKLTFGKAEALAELLQLEPGHVTPFGVLNDEAHVVTLVVDSAIAAGRVGVHPMENTATVYLAMDDVMRLAREHGCRVVVCETE